MNTNYSEMTDLELLTLYKTNEKEKMPAAKALFDRYYPLVCKMRIKLNKSCKNSNLVLDDEDYLTDAWVAFIKSMDSSDLSLIKRSDYGHFIRFKGYLQSMNRDIIHGILVQCKNTVPLEFYNNDDSGEKATNILDLYPDKSTQSSEEEFFKQMKIDVIHRSLESIRPKLTGEQSVILSGLEGNIKKNQVCKTLGITMYKYNLELKEIQKLLSKEMEIQQQKYV